MQTLLVNIVLIVAAAIVATKIYWKMAPYLWSRRKGELIGSHIERIAREQDEKQTIQLNLNMTPRRAFRVRLINVGVFVGFLCFVDYIAPWMGHQFSTDAMLYFGGYVIAGLFACTLVRAVPAELFAGLNWHSRIMVRLYYVWLWPLNVAKAMQRSNTKDQNQP